MNDVLKIIERLMITGIGSVYIVNYSKNTIIHVGDVFCDSAGNRFEVKGIEIPRSRNVAGVEIVTVGLLLVEVDRVEAQGDVLVREYKD